MGLNVSPVFMLKGNFSLTDKNIQIKNFLFSHHKEYWQQPYYIFNISKNSSCTETVQSLANHL